MNTVNQNVSAVNSVNRMSVPRPVTTRMDEPSLLSQLTPRGRRVVATFALMPIVLVLSLVGSHKAAASDSAPETQTVTITQGESLWDVAIKVAPDADPRATIWTIKQLNNMANSDLSYGQSLIVPAS